MLRHTPNCRASAGVVERAVRDNFVGKSAYAMFFCSVHRHPPCHVFRGTTGDAPWYIIEDGKTSAATDYMCRVRCMEKNSITRMNKTKTQSMAKPRSNLRDRCNEIGEN